MCPQLPSERSTTRTTTPCKRVLDNAPASTLGGSRRVPGPPKFQITSRKWNIAAVVGSIIILAVGFGGLFYIQKNVNPTGGVMLAVVIGFGILTALLFVGPGALYPFRKRTAFGKKIMPGGTMTWIRSHMYLPILALVAAIVHASMVPFLTHLTSGVILLVLGVLVSIGGLARHHMIGLKKEALNVNVAINKMAQGQPRHFRELVNDFVENRKPLAEIEAEVAKLDSGEQVIWREIRKMSDDVEKNFPREGGQSSKVLQFQSWRALHPIITILFFAVLAWHVWDVLGGTQAAFGSDKTAFVASNSCADCHDDVVQDWKLSSMADAQTGTIMEAQLPVTLGENEQLAADLGAEQQDRFDTAAKSCINCHAPVGAPFAKRHQLAVTAQRRGLGRRRRSRRQRRQRRGELRRHRLHHLSHARGTSCRARRASARFRSRSKPRTPTASSTAHCSPTLTPSRSPSTGWTAAPTTGGRRRSARRSCAVRATT